MYKIINELRKRGLTMTNTEFQKKLEEMYKEFPLIAMSKKKTINELIFILRHDNEVADYMLNINSESQGFYFGFAKETFFSVRTLALKINSLKYIEDEDSEYPCLATDTD